MTGITHKQLVELITSIRARFGIDNMEDTIYSVCLDVLGGENTTNQEWDDINYRINEAFRDADYNAHYKAMGEEHATIHMG